MLKPRITTKAIDGLNRGLVVALTFVCMNSAVLADPAKPNYAANLARLDQVLKSNPNDESAHYYRAVSLQYLGKYEQARQEYEWVAFHSKNPTLVKYSNTALRALAPLRPGGVNNTATEPPAPNIPGLVRTNKAKYIMGGNPPPPQNK